MKTRISSTDNYSFILHDFLIFEFFYTVFNPNFVYKSYFFPLKVLSIIIILA